MQTSTEEQKKSDLDKLKGQGKERGEGGDNKKVCNN